jgi:hypothetical protein
MVGRGFGPAGQIQTALKGCPTSAYPFVSAATRAAGVEEMPRYLEP